MGNAIEADEEQLKSLHRKLHTHTQTFIFIQ